MIKLGIIGAGGITRALHVKEIKSLPSLFCIQAVADPAPHMPSLAEELGTANIFADYMNLLQDASIEAVLVSTPHDLHEEICINAFKAGKHVLVEKPLATSVKEAENIIRAAEKAGKVLLVGHNERYIPAHLEIKKMLAENRLGRVFGARADHYQNFNPPESSWWRDKARAGGGAVIGSGVHRLDLLLWYLGEAAEVCSYQTGVPFRSNAEILNASIIKFKSGAIAEFFCNWGIFSYPHYETISVFGEEGHLTYGQNNSGQLLFSGQNQPEATPIACPPAEGQWAHFYNCIRHGKKPLIGAGEALQTTRLLEAIYLSAETGKAVAL